MSAWTAVAPRTTSAIAARGAAIRLDDEPLLEHAMHRAVEGARPEAELASGACFDVLDDRVAVPVAVGERQEDVEGDRWQGEESVDVGRVVVHGAHAGT